MIVVGAKLEARRMYFDDIPDALFVDKGEMLTVVSIEPNSSLVYCMNEFGQYGWVAKNLFEFSDSTSFGRNVSSSDADRELPSAPDLEENESHSRVPNFINQLALPKLPPLLPPGSRKNTPLPPIPTPRSGLTSTQVSPNVNSNHVSNNLLPSQNTAHTTPTPHSVSQPTMHTTPSQLSFSDKVAMVKNLMDDVSGNTERATNFSNRLKNNSSGTSIHSIESRSQLLPPIRSVPANIQAPQLSSPVTPPPVSPLTLQRPTVPPPRVPPPPTTDLPPLPEVHFPPVQPPLISAPPVSAFQPLPPLPPVLPRRNFSSSSPLDNANSEQHENQKWFVGTVDRRGAEKLLMDPEISVGTFLVRKSDTTHGYVISVKCDLRSSKHWKINELNSRFSLVDVLDEAYQYKSLKELVDSHKSAQGGSLLRKPYNKNREEKSEIKWKKTISMPSKLLPPLIATPSIMNRKKIKPKAPLRPKISPPQPIQGSYAAPQTISADKKLAKISDELKNWMLDGGNILKIQQIGNGHYGFVWRGKCNGKEVAMKTFNDGTMDVAEFLEEAETMKDIKHPNLVKLYGICLDPEIFLVMEYHPNGNVESYVQKISLSTGQKQNISKDVAVGMSYLAELKYIHRDLAARNVLLGNDLTAKIADFGLTRLIKEDVYTQSNDVKMAWRWTAPEVLADSRFWTVKCDVWSYGIFCWELYTNCQQMPYKDQGQFPIRNTMDLLLYIDSGGRLQKPEVMSDAMYAILEGCWQREPDDRLAIESAFEHLENLPQPDDPPKSSGVVGSTLKMVVGHLSRVSN